MLTRLMFGQGSDVDLTVEVARLQGEVTRLTSENAELGAANAALEGQVTVAVSLGENLKQQLAELKARLGANSRNSSKPPSSDGPSATPRKPKARRAERASWQDAGVGGRGPHP